ncbi:MAG: SAF domain-containing protein [Anaerolineales bacterium]
MKRILPIIFALIALAAAFVGARYWQENYLAGISTVKVPVPKADIQPYTPLTASLFVMQDLPRSMASGGVYLASTEDVKGAISSQLLPAGLPVAKRLAVPAAQFRLADPNLEVISLPAEATIAAGGQVHIGEQINIYCLIPVKQSSTDSNAPQPTPIVELVARVPVVDVLASAGDPLVSTGNNGQTETKPMAILVVAAPHETVQGILDAIALVEHEGAKLWVTLATP